MSPSTRSVVIAALALLLVGSAAALPAAASDAPGLSDVSLSDISQSDLAVTGGSDAVTSAADHQTNESTTDGETDGSGESPGATLSGVVAGEQRTLDGELQTEEYVVRLEAADSQEERSAILHDMAFDLESRLAATEATAERHATTDRAHIGESAYLETAIRVDTAFIDRDAAIGLTLSGTLSSDQLRTELRHRLDLVRNRTTNIEERLANRTDVQIDTDVRVVPPEIDLNETDIDLNGTELDDPLGNETGFVAQLDEDERESLETFLAAVDAGRNVSDLDSFADLADIAANASESEGYRTALLQLGAELALHGDGEYNLSALRDGEINMTALQGYEDDFSLEDADYDAITDVFGDVTDETTVDDSDILTVFVLSRNLSTNLTDDTTDFDGGDDGSDDGGTEDPDSDVELAIVDLAATAQVPAGETFVVDATVENVGTATGESDVTLTVDGPGTVDGTIVQVEAGSSRTVELGWPTTLDDVGQYEATVATDDDSITFAFEVVEDL